MKDSPIKKDWLRILSPAVLAIICSVLGIIVSYSGLETSAGWSFLGVIMLVPVIGILLPFDLVIKLIFKDRTLIIWIVEILILGLIYLLWISRFM
jgi:hypothetical protein